MYTTKSAPTKPIQNSIKPAKKANKSNSEKGQKRADRHSTPATIEPSSTDSGKKPAELHSCEQPTKSKRFKTSDFATAGGVWPFALGYSEEEAVVFAA
jgi:hypothetical protein